MPFGSQLIPQWALDRVHTLCCRKIYSNMHMHMLQRFGIGHIQRVAMGKSMGVEHKRKLSSPIGATVLDEPLAGWPPPANGLLMARPGGLLAPGPRRGMATPQLPVPRRHTHVHMQK